MIKKILFSFILCFMGLGVAAQYCTPDDNINTSGYYPDELDTAQEMKVYDMTVQVYSKRDTMVDNPFGGGQVAATIDTIIVKQVYGMPPGLQYACNPSDCKFVSLKTHCINIYGTPTQASAGIYPLRIVVDVKARINGTFPVTQEEEITDFSIVVKDDDISTTAELVKAGIQLFPNPFKDKIELHSASIKISGIKVTNNIGLVVYSLKDSGLQTKTIDSQNWSTGVYFIEVSLEDGTVIKSKTVKI